MYKTLYKGIKYFKYGPWFKIQHKVTWRSTQCSSQKYLAIFRDGLQTVIPLLIRGVAAYALRFWAVTHLIRYALVWVTTARWSPITHYIVFYPDLLAVGGGTRDMCTGIVRQDYTGAHFHARGWTSPQRLFILRLLRREKFPKFKMTRQFLSALSFETFFIATCLIRPSLHC